MGVYNFTLTATDAHGNMTTQPFSFDWNVTLPPIIHEESETETGALGATITSPNQEGGALNPAARFANARNFNNPNPVVNPNDDPQVNAATTSTPSDNGLANGLIDTAAQAHQSPASTSKSWYIALLAVISLIGILFFAYRRSNED